MRASIPDNVQRRAERSTAGLDGHPGSTTTPVEAPFTEARKTSAKVHKQSTRSLLGVLEELRCLPDGRLEFVVTKKNLTFVLSVDQPRELEIQGDENATRALSCGPQKRRVVARYIPVDGQDQDKANQGKLVSITFLEGI
jgi:hypothetical protein